MKKRLLAMPAAVAVGVIAFAGPAGATNLEVSVDSKCVGTSWVVTGHIQSDHNAPLHYTFDNSVKEAGGVLQPGQSKDTVITVSDNTFSYKWSTTDGHLVGKTSDTLTRPEGCRQPSTSVPGTTSTTTCDQAIPPDGSGCGAVTTVPPPPASTTPTTVKVCADGQPPSVPVEDGSYVCPEYGAPPAPTSIVPTTAAASSQGATTVPLYLPPTGSSAWIVWIGVALVAAGGSLIVAKHFDR